MRMRLFRSLSLRQRVFGFMALLGALPLACFAMSAYSLSKAREAESAMVAATAGAIALERINANIFAIVMESRGLYLSNTIADGVPFAKNMDRFLGQLALAVEEWKSNVIPSERARIEKLSKSVDAFNDLRRELVGLAGEGRFDEIRAKGNNQLNRAVRSELNAQVTALATSYLNHQKGAEELKKALAETNRMLLIALASISIMICASGSIILNRTVLQLFARMRIAMMALAAGNLEAEFEGVTRGDEIGDFARAFKAFKDGGINEKRLARDAVASQTLIDAERERGARDQAERQKQLSVALDAIGEGLHMLAEGKVAVQIGVELAPEYARLKSDFNTTASRLRGIVGEVQEGSTAISHNAEEISRASDTLSRRTEQQAANLEQTASALSQLSAKVSSTATTCTHAHEVVEKARTTAEDAAQIVARAISSVGGIEKSSAQIGQITAVIDEIAFQTNLLALNAGVEAARAGESGRGFAVVASEVRALAQRSASAAKEIKDLVATSSQLVREGVGLVGDTGKALDAIREHVRSSTDEIVAIAASAKEQATGIAELNGAVQQLDKATQDNAAMAEETTAAGHALKEQAYELVALVGQFDLGHSTRRALAA